LPKGGQVSLDDVLQNIGLHQVVGVNQNISGANDSPPGDRGPGRTVWLAQSVGCLSDDFQIPANRVKNDGFPGPLPALSGGVGQNSVYAVADVNEIKARILHGRLKRQGLGQDALANGWVQAARIDEIDWGLQQLTKILK
jgi:hypothetical protein